MSSNVPGVCDVPPQAECGECRRGTATIYSQIGRVRGAAGPGANPEAPRAAGEWWAGAPYAVLDDVFKRELEIGRLFNIVSVMIYFIHIFYGS